MKLPLSLKKYFWDVRFEKMDLAKRQGYIADRILEHGDAQALRWLFRHFPKKVIEDAARKSRTLSPKSAYFWAAYFGIKKNQMQCFQKSFQKLQNSHWQS